MKKSLVLITVVTLSKVLFMTIFSFWLFVGKNSLRLPMMTDQEMYIADIEMIRNDITAVLAPDSAYSSENTLYARISGLLGWFMQYVQIPPLYPALLVNVFSQVFIAYYTTKLYLLADGRYPRAFFVVLSFAPSLSAYSFFALRDLFLLAFFSAFLYYAFKKDYKSALLISLVFTVLRRFFLAFNILILFMMLAIGRVLRSKRVGLSILAYGLVSLTVVFAVLASMNLTWIGNALGRHDPIYFVASSMGLSRFVTEEDVGHVSEEAGKAARVIMFDSLILPFTSFLSLIILVKRGTFLDKQIALTTVMISLGLSMGYLALQGNFPLRKLLPAIPLMYVVVFIAFERLSEKKAIPVRESPSTEDLITYSGPAS